jgi:hypothetical protein
LVVVEAAAAAAADPHRHEIVNDVFEGRPIAVTW